MTPKPWAIVATCPKLTRRTLGSYSARSCAESDAQKYRRFLGNMYTIRVIWSPEDP